MLCVFFFIFYTQDLIPCACMVAGILERIDGQALMLYLCIRVLERRSLVSSLSSYVSRLQLSCSTQCYIWRQMDSVRLGQLCSKPPALLADS